MSARCLLAALLLGACSAEAAAPAAAPARFYVVGPNGTRSGTRSLLPGFGVAITEEVMLGAQRMGRTRQGRLLPMRDLQPAHPSSFRGEAIVEGRMNFAWIGPSPSQLWSRPEARGKPKALRKAHTVVRLREENGPHDWVAVDGGWMRAADLRRPGLTARPNQARPSAPWIDVDLASQTLVAYEGDRPVFATLVSTGIGKPGTTFATPRGVHPIEIKLLAATMDNIEHDLVVPYSYEDVPHTQYIGRVALHGAFWHDDFGKPVSHGCINVSVQDAEHLFALTLPALPQGQTQISASAQKSSVIRVR
jgi:L,D-transpeptidase catalytic domain